MRIHILWNCQVTRPDQEPMEEWVGLTDEKDRWYGRFERLLDRTKKLGEELGKSSLGSEDKAELWEFFRSFYVGISKDLEKQYPTLKKER